MKIVERIALILFSIIMMVIAVMSCLVIFNVVELKSIFNFLEEMIQNQTASRVILCSSAIAILLSIKSLFFPSRMKKKQEIKTGVLLENRDGRLLISRDTIENLVNSVVRSFDEAIDIQTKVNLDYENNITVYVSLLVREDAVIGDLSSNIQNKIKETIRRNTGLEVEQVNINVKDIENNKSGVKNDNQAKLSANNLKENNRRTYESKQLKSTNDKTGIEHSIDKSVENKVESNVENSIQNSAKESMENSIEDGVNTDNVINYQENSNINENIME